MAKVVKNVRRFRYQGENDEKIDGQNGKKIMAKTAKISPFSP